MYHLLLEISAIATIFFLHRFTVEYSIDQGFTTPSPMLSALPDSPGPVGFNETGISQQSMWFDEVEYVDLEK